MYVIIDNSDRIKKVFLAFILQVGYDLKNKKMYLHKVIGLVQKISIRFVLLLKIYTPHLVTRLIIIKDDVT